MKWKLGFLGLLLFTVSAHARLGDTEDELIKRFGTPVARTGHSVYAQGKAILLGPSLAFRQDDWNISCDLIDGRCVRISYSKRGDWSEDHIKLVLTANAQGATWTEAKNSGPGKPQRNWTRTDGSTAMWLSYPGMTLVWDTYNKAKAKAEERAKVEAKQKPKI